MRTKLPVLLLMFCAVAFLSNAQNSPHITRVFEYRPAPGQFVNELPIYEAGDTPETMALKAQECIANDEKIMVTLGGYGGYIVVGFDHSIVNVQGQSDFKILGNAFWANANPNPDAPARGGSCEPGIVMVSVDENKNGLPDDPWYELAGSEYNKPETIKNYQITYYKPDENKPRDPDNDYPFLNDTTYIRWTTNGHGSGHLYRNTFHNQPYYPQWISDSEITFTGTKLANNYIDESGNGSYFVQYSYPWGYADNAPNTDPMSDMNIEWAVDSKGNSVHLHAIDFIKIYTGVNQYCGWLGETSTEVLGVTDLHPEAIVTSTQTTTTPKAVLFASRERLTVRSDGKVEQITIYDTWGKVIKVAENTKNVDLSDIPTGIYIVKLKIDNQFITRKIIK